MRIIGGTAGGTLLKVPKGYDVRPTPDRVRLALFNSLAALIDGRRVLELFAGTGAFSLECLSRGASSAICIEKSSRHARILKENLKLTRLPTPLLSVRIQDALTAVAQLRTSGQVFDLIFADPPYGPKNLSQRSTSSAQSLLDDERLPGILAGEGLFVLGHAKRDTLSVEPPWEEWKTLKHGDSLMRFLRLHESPPGH